MNDPKLPEPKSSVSAAMPGEAPRDDAHLKAWNDALTRKAVAEADAGDFATKEEVEATFRKFLKDA